MKKEIWRLSCKNSRNIYEVSNFGNVRKNGKEFDCKISRNGYKYFAGHFVHREVYILFIGEIPEKFVVHHIDGNSINNHVENLKCMSKSDHTGSHATGHVVSESTKKKLSKANTGHKISELTKKKMSEAHTGHVVSELTKKKMSEAHTGHVVSESTKKKLSKANSGEKASSAKLTCKDVSKIRELLSKGKLTQTEIAKMFNVSQGVISYIKSGKSWKKDKK